MRNDTSHRSCLWITTKCDCDKLNPSACSWVVVALDWIGGICRFLERPVAATARSVHWQDRTGRRGRKRETFTRAWSLAVVICYYYCLSIGYCDCTIFMFIWLRVAELSSVLVVRSGGCCVLFELFTRARAFPCITTSRGEIQVRRKRRSEARKCAPLIRNIANVNATVAKGERHSKWLLIKLLDMSRPSLFVIENEASRSLPFVSLKSLLRRRRKKERWTEWGTYLASGLARLHTTRARNATVHAIDHKLPANVVQVGNEEEVEEEEVGSTRLSWGTHWLVGW